MSKKKEAAEKADIKVTSKTTEVIKADLPQVKEQQDEPQPSMGSGNKDSRARLPKVIISTYNKEGQLTTIQYTCSEIRFNSSTDTVLKGGQPTSRKDTMQITIDADVVEVL